MVTGCQSMDVSPWERAKDLGIKTEGFDKIRRNLDILLHHHVPTYEHSCEVGLVATEIYDFMRLDPRIIFYGGCLHDRGKRSVPYEVLRKTDDPSYGDFTAEDMIVMRNHPLWGYEHLMADGMLASAWIAALHHTFQMKPYPIQEDLPQRPPELRNGSWFAIEQAARYVSIADHSLALKRNNNRNGSQASYTNGREVLMLEMNPDQHQLIKNLYDAHILD